MHLIKGQQVQQPRSSTPGGLLMPYEHRVPGADHQKCHQSAHEPTQLHSLHVNTHAAGLTVYQAALPSREAHTSRMFVRDAHRPSTRLQLHHLQLLPPHQSHTETCTACAAVQLSEVSVKCGQPCCWHRPLLNSPQSHSRAHVTTAYTHTLTHTIDCTPTTATHMNRTNHDCKKCRRLCARQDTCMA